MKVAVVGYGRMGQNIKKILLNEKKITVVTIDKYNENADYDKLTHDSLSDVDVAIDFTFPNEVISNTKIYVKNNINVVMGTTGWYDKINEVKNIVGKNIGFIWSGNFSLGVNIFFRIIKASAKLFNNFSEYDPLLYEIHHKQKQDSPSGTASMIAKILINELTNKKNIITDKLNKKINEDEIHTASIRGGYYPGTHTVMFDSIVDTIELKHTARNRDGFANGSIAAAKWINGKKGFYSIDDYMNDIIK